MENTWHDIGEVDALRQKALQPINVGKLKVDRTHRDVPFSVISGVCNQVGGPLGEGRLDGEYVVCPWHNWKFHCRTGQGEPGFEADAVPTHAVKIENGHVFVNPEPATKRTRAPHEPHPLARKIVRGTGPVRVVGISTTNMDVQNPRYSTSDELLKTSLKHAEGTMGAETRSIRLCELSFRSCEGYYSKSAHACTWPCSITQMDSNDQLDRVYEA